MPKNPISVKPSRKVAKAKQFLISCEEIISSREGRKVEITLDQAERNFGNIPILRKVGKGHVKLSYDLSAITSRVEAAIEKWNFNLQIIVDQKTKKVYISK